MRSIKSLAFASLAALSVASYQASATDATTFNGNYDIEYRSVAVDLLVEISLPGSVTPDYTLPLAFDVVLENELVPYSAVQPVIDNAALALEEYVPNMPDPLNVRIMLGLEDALYTAVDTINDQSSMLLDVLSVAVVNARLGSCDVLFQDLDGSGNQTKNMGSLDANTGLLVVMPLFSGYLNDQVGEVGPGSFAIEDVDVTQMVKGVKVRVVGGGVSLVDLERLP